MQIQQVQHPIHDASLIKPETTDDVLVYFKEYFDSRIFGCKGYYSPVSEKWNVDDDQCDRYNGDNYRQLDNVEHLEKVIAWSKLPEIVITA